MTGCSGCGKPLGFKKYKFHRMWRIPGYYCRECMLKLGKDFDEHGRITTPTHACDLCKVQFHFLESAWQGKKQGRYCSVCREAISSGVIPDKNFSKDPVAQKPPQVMMIFAGLGVVMMALGLVFTLLVVPGGGANLANILFGSVTTALGFVLFKKTVRSRSLIMGGAKAQKPLR
ncbi:MAG TPA: hypothetical protein VJP79_10295 [Nitrososphaera sp.]|nr:hypothetical protein [Nitrososphaera sp.]